MNFVVLYVILFVVKKLVNVYIMYIELFLYNYNIFCIVNCFVRYDFNNIVVVCFRGGGELGVV